MGLINHKQTTETPVLFYSGLAVNTRMSRQIMLFLWAFHQELEPGTELKQYSHHFHVTSSKLPPPKKCL